MDKRNQKSSNLFIAYSTIGIQLALILLLFIYGGYRLDNYYDASPVFIIIGAFAGLCIGFYNLIRELKGLDDNKPGDSEEKTNKKKWSF